MLCLLLCLGSCNKSLDVTPRDKYSNEIVWKNVDNLDLYINSLYGALYMYAEIGGVSLTDGYADIIKYSQTYMDTEHNRINMRPSYLSPASTEALSPWATTYEKIKSLNEFIIDAGRYGDKIDAKQLQIRIAEVRFLRAFLYHKLIVRHGGVVLRVDNEKLDGPAEKNKKRSSVDESWTWVIQELKDIAEKLPESWDAVHTGRITKGAAYGIMARSALYAKKWNDAIFGARQVEILATAKGTYMLLDDYTQVFNLTHNKEIILASYYQRPTLTHDFDKYFSPTGDMERYGGYASPTEELVSSFDIQQAGQWQAFDWNNPLHASDPYLNREPRFYATVLYNGADWKGRQIETYVGGKDGYIEYFDGNARNRTVTGYFIRKFLDSKPKDFIQEKSDQYWIEMRYAEILCILSEAYAHMGDYGKAYNYLNKIRNRVGLPNKPLQSSWTAYLQDLQKEKICEFAVEGHRYWDLRRWQLAQSVLDAKRMHGVEITKEGTGFTYSVVDCDKADHYFPERYYTVPIPEFEVRNNTACEQDLLWQ